MRHCNGSSPRNGLNILSPNYQKVVVFQNINIIYEELHSLLAVCQRRIIVFIEVIGQHPHNAIIQRPGYQRDQETHCSLVIRDS